jgi:hypothetical protein
MYKNSNAVILSILFTLLAISLAPTLHLNQITNASLDNIMDSKIKIIKLSTKKATPEQQDNGIQASGHFANNQIQNGSVTWIQGGLWDLVVHST